MSLSLSLTPFLVPTSMHPPPCTFLMHSPPCTLSEWANQSRELVTKYFKNCKCHWQVDFFHVKNQDVGPSFPREWVDYGIASTNCMKSYFTIYCNSISILFVLPYLNLFALTYLKGYIKSISINDVELFARFEIFAIIKDKNRLLK